MENFDFHANYQMDELPHLYPGHGAHPPVDQQGEKQPHFEFQPYMLTNQGMGNTMNSIPESQQEMFSVDQQHNQLDALLQERMHSIHSSGLNDSFNQHTVGHYNASQKTPASEMPGLSHMDMHSGFAMPGPLTESQEGNQAQLSSMPQVGTGQGNLRQQKPFPPLEPSAITPASVFSTVSSASTNDFLSPITSPMLQPQAGQSSMFGLGENEMQVSYDMFNGNTSSPSSSLLNRENAGAYPQGYAPVVKNNNNRSSVVSPISPPERPHMRRARTMDKSGRVRPSPLMKPVQSPKTGPTNLVWTSYKRENSSNSPALGAIESLSSTMQDASTFTMPSPSLSPALLALNGRGGSQLPGPPSRSHSLNESVQTLPVKSDQTTEFPSSARTSLANSPSPIDLAQNEYNGSSVGQAMPATPGTLMGLVNPTSQQAQPLTSQEQQASPSVSQPSTSMAQEPRQMHHGYPATQLPPESRTNQVPENISSFNAQDAVHAVATTAMVNAAQARSNLMYMAPHHKTILPGGLSSEERNAWMNMRRVGHGVVDQRRTSHKAAEQKRRDSLKYCFDELRTLLPAITVDDSLPSGSMLGPDGTAEDRLAEGFDTDNMKSTGTQKGSAGDLTPEQAREANRAVAKVLLLRHSNEYLIRLKRRIERRDLAVQSLSEEVVRLRALLADAEKGKGDVVDANVSSELSFLTIQQNGSSTETNDKQTMKINVNDNA